MIESVDERLYLYMRLVHSGCGMAVWAYSDTGDLYYTNSMYEKELKMFFTAGGCMEFAMKEGKELKGPFIMSDSLGMVWLGEFAERPGKENMFVLVGPAFFADSSIRSIERSLQQLNLSVQMFSSSMKILKNIPVVSIDMFKQYGRMLHTAIVGEPVETAKIVFQYSEPKQKKKSEDFVGTERDYESQYSMECLLMQCVKDGNRNYKEVFDQLRYTNMDMIQSKDPRRLAINMMITLTTQCARAAIEGGVSPKIAKSMELNYVLEAETKQTLTELIQLNRNMLEDFIERVNEFKTNYGVSKPIQECCMYVKEHLSEELTLEKIAKEIGYTEYYLSRKFQKEMGVKLLDYIKEHHFTTFR